MVHTPQKSGLPPSPGKRPARRGASPRDEQKVSRDGFLPRDRGSLRLAREHILAEIADGRLQPGKALAELPLAAKIGVSRTPVREAIGQLVAEGFLQKTSRGVTIAEPTRRDIVELYEVREALEVFSIGRITARGLEASELDGLEMSVTEIRAVTEELKRSGEPALKGEALQRFLASDLRFHMRLIQAGGNERMLKMLDATNLLLRIFTFRREHHTVKLLKDVHHFHRRILDAVAAGDSAEAARLLGEHIRISREERLAEYEALHQAGRGW
jgi:DNA-binding GntR family transcriptional regulator